jgi:hypothetical protein
MPRLMQRLFYQVVMLSLLVFVTACAKTDKEEEVYQLIKQGVELAQEHKLGQMMDLTREGFSVEPGNHSSKEVRRILFATFKRFGKFRIHYPKPSVKLSEDEETALVKMSFIMATQDQLFPDLELLYQEPGEWLRTVDRRADVYTLSMELDYKSGSWLVKKARISGFTRPHGRL